MSKKLLSLIAITAVLVPVSCALAATPTIAGMAESIAGQVVLVATWIVVIMWVVTGIIFLTAQGDPGKINTGKTALFASIGGTILIILAQSAIALVKNSFGI